MSGRQNKYKEMKTQGLENEDEIKAEKMDEKGQTWILITGFQCVTHGRVIQTSTTLHQAHSVFT